MRAPVERGTVRGIASSDANLKVRDRQCTIMLNHLMYLSGILKSFANTY